MPQVAEVSVAVCGAARKAVVVLDEVRPQCDPRLLLKLWLGCAGADEPRQGRLAARLLHIPGGERQVRCGGRGQAVSASAEQQGARARSA